jgi:hypothetical protein
MGRQLISVRDGEGDKPDAEDDQCIAVFASVQIETTETESAQGTQNTHETNSQ